MLLLTIWVVSALIFPGMWMHYMIKRFPLIAYREYTNDLIIGILLGIISGPLVVLLVSLFILQDFGPSGFGWTLLPPEE